MKMSKIDCTSWIVNDCTSWIVKGKPGLYCTKCRRFTYHDKNENGLWFCCMCMKFHYLEDLKKWLNYEEIKK